MLSGGARPRPGVVFPSDAGAAHAALPNGSIAVLVKSVSAQEAAQTASVFTRQLLAKGYKVVNIFPIIFS